MAAPNRPNKYANLVLSPHRRSIVSSGWPRLRKSCSPYSTVGGLQLCFTLALRVGRRLSDEVCNTITSFEHTHTHIVAYFGGWGRIGTSGVPCRGRYPSGRTPSVSERLAFIECVVSREPSPSGLHFSCGRALAYPYGKISYVQSGDPKLYLAHGWSSLDTLAGSSPRL